MLGKSSRKTILEKQFSVPKNTAAGKIGNGVINGVSYYDNSDVIATLIITNVHLCLIQLWWQFFQIFVYGDVVYNYAQTWDVITLKNCIEPP